MWPFAMERTGPMVCSACSRKTRGTPFITFYPQYRTNGGLPTVDGRCGPSSTSTGSALTAGRVLQSTAEERNDGGLQWGNATGRHKPPTLPDSFCITTSHRLSPNGVHFFRGHLNIMKSDKGGKSSGSVATDDPRPLAEGQLRGVVVDHDDLLRQTGDLGGTQPKRVRRGEESGGGCLKR